MRVLKLFVLLILSMSLLTNIASAKNKKDDFKVLAGGFHSEVDKPFVFVARSAETYDQLKALAKDLPDAATIDFSKNAVVAGFAGNCPTGGWSVEINQVLRNQAMHGVTIGIKSPEKGVMSTQMITTPFKIVQVPVTENEALPVLFSDNFTSRLKMSNYRLSKGNFGFSGGLAGRHKDFTADGTISVLTYGDLATFTFVLQGKEAESKRQLSDTASGILKDGAVNLARVDAGSFSDPPRPSFSVTGNLTDTKLTLTFAPLSTIVSDSYAGSGSLEAVQGK